MSISTAGADVRKFGIDFGSNVGSRGSVSGLKQRLVSVKFILAGFGPERSHGDLFRDQNSGFGIDRLAWLHWLD